MQIVVEVFVDVVPKDDNANAAKVIGRQLAAVLANAVESHIFQDLTVEDVRTSPVAETPEENDGSQESPDQDRPVEEGDLYGGSEEVGHDGPAEGVVGPE